MKSLNFYYLQIYKTFYFIFIKLSENYFLEKFLWYNKSRNSDRRISQKGKSMSTISTTSIQVAYDQRLLLTDWTANSPRERLQLLSVAMAAGKSTLLKAFTRILPTKAGGITLDGQSISLLPTKEVAQRLPYCPKPWKRPMASLFMTWSLMAAFRIKLAWAGSVQKTGKNLLGYGKQLRSKRIFGLAGG